VYWADHEEVVVQEPEGFREFVAARSPALLRSAWLLTGDEELAQDLVQTALARIWPHWSRLAVPSRAEGYVRRVIVTTYANWWRRRWRAERPTANLPDRSLTSDDFAVADVRHDLAVALATLTPRQRAVVVLRYFEDLTEAQTADLLGCTVGTVKSQTHKALARLRQHPWLARQSAKEWQA
jgi:RNA polymerase sigma-70 factor (sigma-E family)